MTLLEKALSAARPAVSPKDEVSDRQLRELAVAVLFGEITLSQAAIALEIKPNGRLYVALLNACSRAALRGELVRAQKETGA